MLEEETDQRARKQYEGQGERDRNRQDELGRDRLRPKEVTPLPGSRHLRKPGKERGTQGNRADTN